MKRLYILLYGFIQFSAPMLAGEEKNRTDCIAFNPEKVILDALLGVPAHLQATNIISQEPTAEIAQPQTTPTKTVQQKQLPASTDNSAPDIFSSPKEKLEHEKLQIKRHQLALAESKEYIHAIKAQAKSAKSNDLRLDRMLEKIKNGNLPNATLWSTLTNLEEQGPIKTGGIGALAGGALGSVAPGVGAVAGGLLGGVLGGLAGSLVSPLASAIKSIIRARSADIPEYEKLSADFIRNAKDFFGARMTDADLRAYMQTIPTLMIDDEGKKSVIENIKGLNKMIYLEDDAMRGILKAHNGIPPLDLEQQVQDRIADQKDALAQKFIARV